MSLGESLEAKGKAELKSRILRLLSVDARISMQDLANDLKTTKVNAYNLFNEVSNEYGMRFVPEISIDKLWKWEFIKRARLRTKRGILAEAVEELPLTGFGEYLVFIKFSGKKPDDAEIVKAMGTSYAAQFAARTRGEYDLVIYVVERSYEDAVRFTDMLSRNLGKYKMLAYTSRVWGSFGFFPLNNKLIEQFDIFDTYKNLLFGLNDGGRSTFTEIGKRYSQGPAQMLYAYDRLARTEILKRVTYFESRPGNSFSIVAIVKTQSENQFDESKDRWFASLVRNYDKNTNECIFMCDTPTPKGMVVVGSFANKSAADRFLSAMKSGLKGAQVGSMQILKVIVGSLGVRDFDMRYAPQYKHLERKKMVPALARKGVEAPVEDPNALDR
jgi:DNA-binding Lrp family transcriptional regulator